MNIDDTSEQEQDPIHSSTSNPEVEEGSTQDSRTTLQVVHHLEFLEHQSLQISRLQYLLAGQPHLN